MVPHSFLFYKRARWMESCREGGAIKKLKLKIKKAEEVRLGFM